MLPAAYHNRRLHYGIRNDPLRDRGRSADADAQPARCAERGHGYDAQGVAGCLPECGAGCGGALHRSDGRGPGLLRGARPQYARGRGGRHHAVGRRPSAAGVQPAGAAYSGDREARHRGGNGVAAGAGANIALACDIRIASETASFVQAFVKIGLVPDSGGIFFLPMLVGSARRRARLHGGPHRCGGVPATRPLQSGRACGRLVEKTRELAIRLAALPTRAIGLTKRAFNRAVMPDLEAVLEYEADMQNLAAAPTTMRRASPPSSTSAPPPSRASRRRFEPRILPRGHPEGREEGKREEERFFHSPLSSCSSSRPSRLRGSKVSLRRRRERV